MGITWDKLSPEECVARSATVSRQALSATIKKYEAKGDVKTAHNIKLAKSVLREARHRGKLGDDAYKGRDRSLSIKAQKKRNLAEFQSVESVEVRPGISVTRGGRVWSHFKSCWLGYHGMNGYTSVASSHGQLLVHRLVAEAFIPNPDRKQYVNHIDGIKSNNNVSNLEWVTPRENTAHALSTGLFTPGKYGGCVGCKGEAAPSAKLTASQVLSIRAEYAAGGTSHVKLSEKYKVSASTIQQIVNRKKWTHI